MRIVRYVSSRKRPRRALLTEIGIDLAVLAVFVGLLLQHTAGASTPMPQRERAIESLGGFAQVLL